MIVTWHDNTKGTLLAETHLERDGLEWLLEKLQMGCSAVDTSDRGLLRRLLSDVVSRCEKCQTRPVTVQYFWESDHSDHAEGAGWCCDDCVPLLEAKAQGGKIISRDTENAALVRELVARCAGGDAPDNDNEQDDPMGECW